MIPRLILFYGNIGAGKTTIAEILSKRLDYGLVHFDNIMWIVTGRDRIYDDNDNFLLTMDEILKIYDSMHLIAKYLLNIRKGVILESLYLQKQRENAISVAKECGCPYCIIEVRVNDDVTEERLLKRKNLNPQSAGMKVFREYKPKQEPEQRKHMTVTNHGSVEEAVDEIISRLEEYTIE